ncbi:MAG TPA: hypothetical protein VFD32_23215 [Dehalococcoidia bacterium]|nr:hypothetical protein [Dehalococcoidia bacterium]
MSIQRSGLVARWAALSGPDRLVAALWGALALLLAGVGVVALLRTGPHAPPAQRPERVAPAAIPRRPSSNAAQPTAFAAVGSAGAVVTPASAPSAPAAAPPAPTPTTAAGVPDAALVPPGATLVRRVNLATPGGPGAIVSLWQTPATDGCMQPHITVLGLNAAGQWGAIWDAGTGVGGAGQLISPAALSGDRCFPEIGLFAVQPLDPSGAPYLAFSVLTADGRQQLVAQPLDDRTATPAVVMTVPAGAQLGLGDGLPAVLQVTLPVIAPAGAGLAAVAGQPIAHVDALYRWQNGSFQAGGGTLALNCLSGSVLESVASAAGVAIAFGCPDGTVAAVTVTPVTKIAGNLLVGGLQPGDDLSVSLLPSDAPACQTVCTALPAAAQVSSQMAAARQAQPPAARQPAAPTTSAAPPVVTPTAAGTGTGAPQSRPAASSPAQAAPTAPSIRSTAAAATATALAPAEDGAAPSAHPPVSATVVAPARPIPSQPAYVAPRPIPTQPR